VGVLRRALTDAERAEVAAWRRSNDRVRHVRAGVVLLAETAPSAASVARGLGLHVQTVREMLRWSAAGGLAAIAPRPRPGRPRTFGERAADALVALLHEPPPGDEGRWTLGSAAAALAARLGRPVSTEAVRRLLRRRRCSWQRAKGWVSSPDPAYAFEQSGAPACSPG
jgi:transposase